MTKSNSSTKTLVTLSLIIAIEIMLVITNLGFIMVPPVSITILHIPVIVGAIIMGPKYGAILGGAFGVLSLLNATFRGVSPVDLAFSPFLSGSPISSIIMCIGCRVLLGFIAGLLYKLLSRKNKTVAAIVSSFVATLIHTATVMACLWLLFPDFGMTFKTVLETILALNFLIEASLAVIFALAFARIIPILISHYKK